MCVPLSSNFTEKKKSCFEKNAVTQPRSSSICSEWTDGTIKAIAEKLQERIIKEKHKVVCPDVPEIILPVESAEEKRRGKKDVNRERSFSRRSGNGQLFAVGSNYN